MPVHFKKTFNLLIPGYVLSQYDAISNEIYDLSNFKTHMEQALYDDGVPARNTLKDNPVDIAMEKLSNDNDDFNIDDAIDTSETSTDEYQYDLMMGEER